MTLQFPTLWIVAGPNGAGKTTSVQKDPIAKILPNVSFLNSDDRTLQKLRSMGHSGFADTPTDILTKLFLESADDVFADVQAALAQNGAVGIETVLSSRKYCSLVEQVVEKGGFVGLIYVALSSPALAQERVAARVRRHGHDVPNDKIEMRWKRSLDNLAWFAVRASEFWIIDNSDSNPDISPQLIAFGRFGKLQFLDDNVFPEMKSALAPLPRTV